MPSGTASFADIGGHGEKIGDRGVRQKSTSQDLDEVACNVAYHFLTILVEFDRSRSVKRRVHCRDLK